MPIKKPDIISVPRDFAPTPFTQSNPDILKKPCFSFQYISSMRHVEALEVYQQAELAKQLCIISQKTWQELNNANHSGIGCEVIRKQLSFALPEILTGQTILAFKYCGKLSMVGFRDKNVFHILGIDKDFKHNSCYGHGS